MHFRHYRKNFFIKHDIDFIVSQTNISNELLYFGMIVMTTWSGGETFSTFSKYK